METKDPNMTECQEDGEKRMPLLTAVEDMPKDTSHLTYTRQQLSEQFEIAKLLPSSYSKEDYTLSSTAQEAYSPCHLPVSALKKTFLQALDTDMHHRGEYILLRTFCQPFRMSAVMAAVEDEEGHVQRLAVYNTNTSFRPEELFPKGSVVVIKEPYYKMATDGHCILRVDHASDLLMLEPDNALIPAQWKDHNNGQPEPTALMWKEKGNAALKKKAYLQAQQCYTRGLACLPEDAGESKRDLHRNRSLANLHLGRYDATISDALLSVSDDRDEVARKKDAKALYRTGRANYQLGNLVGALALFEKMLELCPADEKGTAELNKTKTRLLEQETGNYDFAEIINELSKNKFLADRASFVGRTEVGQTSDRGRGLFATQNLAMGDLILCEKAFMVAHTSEPEPAAADHLTQLCILNKLMDNPSLSKGILDLYSGETPKTTAMLIIDGQAVIDVFEIAQIFKYNAFAYAVGNEQQMYGTSGMRAPDAGVSTGIWLRASYANHACNFNSTRSFFGDLIVYRATRDIARGAEITIAYISPTADDEMSKIMLPNWGFNCSCILCNHEAATNVDRSGLLEASNAFLDVHWIGANINFDYEVLEQAVTLAVDFLESYSSNLSLQLPCLGACPIYLWLCQVYFTLGDAENTLATAEEVLRLHGYRLVVEDSTVSLDATHGFLTPGVVDTLMHVFKSLKNLKPALGREFKVLAKRFYLTLNGSLAGFGARYD